MFILLGTIVLAVTLAFVEGAPSNPARACNGKVELCARRYGNITFMGAHDSFAHTKNFLSLGRNQHDDIPEQLKSGIRLLQAQAHKHKDQIYFCHTNCFIFNGGPVIKYLETVKGWLDQNPNEVLTFVFTNPEGFSMKNEWAPLFQKSGIDKISYVPPHQPMKREEWPTLGEMLDSGRRVVTFIDSKADNGDDRVDYLLPEFPHIWETPFDAMDSNFPCSVNRTSGPLNNEEHLHMINHFLDVNLTGILLPDRKKAEETNGVQSILKDAANCMKFSGGKNPNFVLMDWVHKGDWSKAGDVLNGFAKP